MNYSTAFKTLSIAAAMALMPAMAHAEWGRPTSSKIIYEREGEIGQLRTARTSDGYTYLAWWEWNDQYKPASCMQLCMQLLDPDGDPVWGTDGIVIDSYPTRSFTSANSLVVDADDNAYVSWADSRSQIDKELIPDLDERYDNFETVIYKINKDGDLLWGEDGHCYDTTQFSMSPILYMLNGNLFAYMYGIGSGSFISTYMVRLDMETGDFLSPVVPMSGQFIGSLGTDIIRVYGGGSQTLAMRYDKDLNEVWDSPSVVAPFVYDGHSNFPYTLKTDYQGGVIVSFPHSIGQKWMPAVNYITADGESPFGHSVDVTTYDGYNNENNTVCYNPNTESILNVWGINEPHLALGSQMMDIFGERLWNDGAGKDLKTKEGTSGYTYIPLSTIYDKNDNYWILYVDEQQWEQDTMYLLCIDEEGNAVDEPMSGQRVGIYNQGIYNPGIYWEDGSLYIIYFNGVTGKNTHRIRTIKVPDVYQPAETPVVPEPDPEDPEDPDDSGVEAIGMESAASTYFTLDGLRLDAPRKGINIVKDAGGKVSKVVVK